MFISKQCLEQTVTFRNTPIDNRQGGGLFLPNVISESCNGPVICITPAYIVVRANKSAINSVLLTVESKLRYELPGKPLKWTM